MSFRGLNEVTGISLGMNRKPTQDISVSLGCDDLVTIFKIKRAFFSSNITIKFFHYVIGMDQSSVGSFPVYFNELMSKLEKKSWPPTATNYDIEKGSITIYNSFTNNDITIEIEQKGNCKVYSSRDPKHPFTIEKEFAKQLQLSSALRYFKGYSLLSHYLFDTSFWNDISVYVLQEIRLTYDDFVYIANTHTLVNELELAIARGLIQSLSLDQIITFTEQFDYKLPRLMENLLKILHSHEKVMKKFENVIVKHLSRYADDIEATYYYVKYLIKACNTKSAEQFMPLMYSTFGLHPLSAIACALYSIAKEKTQDALAFLNLAGYCKNWPQKPMMKTEYEFTKPNESLPFSVTDNEVSFYRSPLSGPFYEYFDALNVLCSNCGIKYFSNSIKDFTNEKYEKSKEMVSIYYPEYHFEKTSFCEECELFDPGISGAPSMQELSGASITNLFSEYSKYVIKCFQYRNSLISSTSPHRFSSKDLKLAVQLGDPQLYKAIFSDLTKLQISSTDKLLMFKALELGIDRNWNEVINLKTYSNTQHEKNVIDQLTPFFSGLKNVCLC
ncbi:hypothetical protein TVAG_180480 [Trichomonas vaginalis G3]|uniref:Uncharacterized protein n=1 Tax=Trichomonas vaginalis (strain ATCC PRA-98 / G3) TaxID=412133 RepID=A2EE77_TRIV3|nr:bud site selection protein 7-related family [Trichomonas vaginalis G3]EAY09074.1 hypothetical protein TVAG_180480 [Trichomonas vaginalis G3]KAI5503410.1 bud site selection protein 7-related family [Trichomonas vaginalis G3]|eukprot:XP_001321297.1 hypothetical protein [Trichomonas vaginalis G3]